MISGTQRNWIAALVATTTLTPTAWAQSSAEEQQAGAQTDGLEGIIVTARRIDENLQDVPVAVTALSGATLQERSITRIEDIQTQVPNLFLSKGNSDPQSLSLGLRGQLQTSILLTVDPSVGIYVDGVNKPHSLGLAGALVDIARIEVLRGPQGTLYGRNTTGGALSIFSNDPTDDLGASFDVSVGNYNAWNGIAVANVPLTDGLAVRFVAQKGQHDGYAEDRNGNELADAETEYYRLKIRSELGEKVTATFSGSYQTGRGSSAFRLSGLSQAAASPMLRETAAEMYLAAGGAPAGVAAATADPARIAAARAALLANLDLGDFYRTGQASANYSYFRGATAGLTIDAELSDYFTLKSITGYEHQKRFTTQDIDATQFNILQTELRTNASVWSEELQLLGGDENFNWVVGGFFSRESADEFSSSASLAVLNAATNPPVNQGKVRNTSLAGFGQFNWKITPRLGVTAGYRYSSDERVLVSFNRNARGCLVPAAGVPAVIIGNPATQQCGRRFENTYSGPSWLLSANYELFDDVLSYAKVSHGYRTGGQALRGNTTQASFTPFSPEKVTEYEIGLKSELFDRHVRLNLAAYYDNYSDIQRTTTVATPTGTIATIITNAAKGTIKGIEAEAEVRVSSQLRLHFTYGLTDAKYKEFRDLSGDRSREGFGIPKSTLTVGGRFTQPTGVGDLSLNMDYHWQSQVFYVPETPTLSQVGQPSYGLLNARLSLDIEDWDLKVALFARNIAQVHYYVSANTAETGLGFNNRQLGEPRTFGIQLTKSFGGI